MTELSPEADAAARIALELTEAWSAHPVRRREQVLRTTRSALAAALGDAPPAGDDGPVWAVLFSGRFVAPRHPHGRPAPTGAHLLVVVDANRREVSDVHLTQDAPDLVGLGDD